MSEIEMKTCKDCNLKKNITQFKTRFYKKYNKFYTCSVCKECGKKRDAKYREDNREKILEKYEARKAKAKAERLKNKKPKIDPTEKECSRCNTTKDINAYTKVFDKRNGDDYYYYKAYCIECEIEYHRKYKIKRKEKHKKEKEAYLEAHKEEIEAEKKKRLQEKKEYMRQYSKEYRAKYGDKIKAQRQRCYLSNKEYYDNKKKEYRERAKKRREENLEKYKEKNREYYLRTKTERRAKGNAYQRKRYHEDTAFRLRSRLSCRIRGCLKKNGSSKEGDSMLKYLPYTMVELKEHLESKFEEWMSWDNYGPYMRDKWDDEDPTTWKWNIDHIIPHSTLPYDSMDHPNFLKCWNLGNLRPLSSKQNVYEGARQAEG
jgi:hypothetical protein